MEHGKSTTEASLTREINELEGIIGEFTIANETLKKIQLTKRGGRPWMISFQMASPNLDMPILQVFPDRWSIINAERENRNTTPIWRNEFPMSWGKGHHMAREELQQWSAFLVPGGKESHKKVHRKHVPRTMVVARPNVLWETDFTKIYIEGEGWVYLTAYMVCV